MELRPLGNTGLTVSALGFGCGNVGGLMVRGTHEDQVAAVQRAMDAGITYFDTAPSYGNGLSETHLGEVLKELNAWDRVTVGTKLRVEPNEDPGPAVRNSVIESLRRLQTDHVHLVQLHNRIGSGEGAVSPGRLPAVVEAMRAVQREGLVRNIGCTALGDSNAVVGAIKARFFQTAQCYFNAANPSSGYAGVAQGAQDLSGVIDEAAARETGVICIRVLAAGAMVASMERAPLAGGTGGALTAGADYESDVRRAQALSSLARELGLENAMELSLRFVLAKSGVSTALVGYSDRQQLEDAIRWAERGPLPRDAVERVLSWGAQPIAT
jgi:L-galactose dehydrogenase/L-glyceraldehyde 3-phosphate reductase